MRADAIAVLEAAYDLAPSRRAWLTRLLEVVAPEIDGGLGVAVFTYTVTGGKMRIEELVLDDRARPGEARWIEGFHSIAPRRLTDRMYRTRAGCATLSHMAPDFVESRLFRAIFSRLGARDLVGINVIDIADAGIAIGAPIPARRALSRNDDSRWARLGAHINAAARLRRALDASHRPPLDVAEAVYEADGRLAHATGAARDAGPRELLRHLVVEHDRLWGRQVGSDEALDAWQALVDGRWSLVDHFDRDRRHYVVAIPNAPDVPDPRQLTERERQVAHLVALGFANKLVGYHLGLTSSTVASHLGEALRKLRLETRVDLVRFVAALRGVEPVTDAPTE